MQTILNRRIWKVLIGVVSVCGLLLVIGVALARLDRKPSATRTLPGVGRLEYLTRSDGDSLVRVQRPDQTRLIIEYEKGEAKQIIVMHPRGDPLQRKVQPSADGATLATATSLLPELVELAGGQRQQPSPEAKRLLQMVLPAAFYQLPFTNRPGYYRLFQDGSLHLEGYAPRRVGRFPCVIYWGPEGPGPDGPADDLLYCGDWELDEGYDPLPLQLGPENLHRIKAGDVINFRQWTLTVVAIDHDNDGITLNNALILHLQEPLGRVEQGAISGRPITPEGFISEVCWPNTVKLIAGEAGPATLSETEI